MRNSNKSQYDSKMDSLKSGIKKAEIVKLPQQEVKLVATYSDEQLLRIESCYIIPRAKILIDKFGSGRAAAREVAKIDPRMKERGLREAIQRTLGKRFKDQVRPIKWAYPWPYDLVNDKSLSTVDVAHYEEQNWSVKDLHITDDSGDAPKDFHSMITAFKDAQKERQRHDSEARHAMIDFSKHQLPILIFQHTDVHWGSVETDYEAIARHIHFAKTIEGCYVFSTGDLAELAKIRHRSALETQVYGPTMQLKGARSAIVEIWDKVLCFVNGNHDERIFDMTGFDIGEYLIGNPPHGKRPIPFLRDGGLVTIKLGTQTYTNNIFHGDSRFGTMFNENHKGRQTARMVDGYCDLTWNGHTHNPAVQDANEPKSDMQGSRDCAYLQGGSYKADPDGFSRRAKFFTVDEVQMPAAILLPDRHKYFIFKRVEDAIFIYSLIHEEYKKRLKIK